MALIYITLLQPMRAAYLEGLPELLQDAFHARTRVVESDIDISFAFHQSLNQYHGSAILLRLTETAPPEASKILGITEVDLFVPVFDFLFGEAQLGGAGALMSTFRLRNELYGLPADEELFYERIGKEAIHELGHAFGLVHCFNPACVMNPSTFVEQIDNKSKDFCRQCRRLVEDETAKA